jgi:hypothetical protein
MIPTPTQEDAWGGLPTEGKQLRNYARMFPTPTSRDHKDTGVSVVNGTVPVNGLLGRHVQMFPTPLSAPTSDASHNQVSGRWRAAMAKAIAEQMARHISLDEAEEQVRIAQGSLNPAWVCWLMGFPPNWTDIGTPNPLESPASPPE